MIINKYTKSFFILFLILFIIQCDSPNNSSQSSTFSDIEIHYNIFGGWINTSQLDIFPNGLVKAYLIKQDLSILAKDSLFLSEKYKSNLVNLFKSFSEYNRSYRPPVYITDQDYHRIIYIYSGSPDTVDIYMPNESNIPINLKNTLIELQNIWDNTIN
jgi:hypothetical protein